MCVNCEHFSLLLSPSASVEQIKYPILYQNECILLLFFCSTHFSIIILYACRSGWSLFSNILFFCLFVCEGAHIHTNCMVVIQLSFSFSIILAWIVSHSTLYFVFSSFSLILNANYPSCSVGVGAPSARAHLRLPVVNVSHFHDHSMAFVYAECLCIQMRPYKNGKKYLYIMWVWFIGGQSQLLQRVIFINENQAII